MVRTLLQTDPLLSTLPTSVLVGQQSLIPPPFDPRNCKLGLYPGVPVSELPTIQQGSSSSYVGYAKGVLYCKAGQPCRAEALPGPWVFGSSFRSCVISFQTFFGLSVDGVVGPQTWSVIQYLANH
jgi:murein L,D-transpeptidase YcbB/YkuD